MVVGSRSIEVRVGVVGEVDFPFELEASFEGGCGDGEDERVVVL